MDDIPHVMISYQWDSQKQMIKLRDKLKQEGYNVWMDVEKMEGDILESMGKAVEKAAVVLACITEKYQESKSCKTEAEYAFSRNVPIIPLKLKADFAPSSWLGPLIGTQMYYLVDKDEMLQTNFPDLIRALGSRGRKLTPAAGDLPIHAAAADASAARPENSFIRRARKALDCSICLERFRNPKTLPCLHSFCRDCLVGWVPFGTKTVACPQCRQEATVPDGDASKFKTNFHLQELVEEEALQEQISGADSNKFTCTCCDGETQSKAVAKCQDCNHYLCDSGLDAHRRFSALRKHDVLAFEDSNQGNASKRSEASSSASTEPTSTMQKPTELQATVWEIFDALYNEDHSGNLLKYWIQRQGGGKDWQISMVDHYTTCLHELEEDGVISEDTLAKRQQEVARFFMQAGQYDKAVALVEKTIEMETKELGARPEKLADLYGLASTIYLEISKQEDFVHETDFSTLREAIRNARKSIKLRKTLPGDDHKYKLGKTLVVLTFALGAWIDCGGDAVLTKDEAKEEARRHIEIAIKIFKELESKGNLADAVMTKGVLAARGSDEQEKLYMEAHKLCIEAYGECSVLTKRLNLNIGIMYEDRLDFFEAYRWFVKWADVCEKVFGYHHEKTEKTRRLFEEPRYVDIKKQLEATK